jgi:hypothetical protein
MGWMLRFGREVVCGIAAILMAAGAISAQDAGPTPASSTPGFGGPQDWSNRHVIFTRNGSLEDMWKLRDDPRFLGGTLLRYMKEQRARSGQTSANGLNVQSLPENGSSTSTPELERFAPWDPLPIRPIRPVKNKHSNVDWSVSLGPTAGMALGETPAIYTANYSSPSCSNDFAVFTLNATPSASQANLLGLTNLYTTGAGTGFCSGTAPTFMFSYDIGTGPSPLSPVLSLDGTRVAWIENRGGTDAYLHVTVWVANEGGTATSPVVPSGTLTNGVCAPSGSACDFALDYTNAVYSGCTTAYPAINTHSDLYVDYSSNAGFISANNGLLYHIKNIFSSTVNPSVDFCISVNGSFATSPKAAMSGPVYDPLLNEVFITDSRAVYGYKVNASGPTPNFQFVTAYSYGGGTYNYPTGPGPLLDVSNGYLYLFSTNDKAGGTSVTQIPTALQSGTASVASLGATSTNTSPYLFYGAFDNNYFTNGPQSAASTLYTCGTDSSNAAAQDLFALSFNSSTGVMNAIPAMSHNKNVNQGSTTTGVCSPLTEFYDGTNDRLFVGMGQPAASSGSNVVTMWNVNSQLTSASTTPTATANNYLGGTSGIGADNNDSSTAQAESIYFSTENVGSNSTLVNENSYFNNTGIYGDGQKFSCTGGLDGDGYAYSSNLLGGNLTWNGTTFNFGPSGNADVWTNTTIPLPSGEYSTLTILAAAVNVTETGIAGTFKVNYSDGTSTSITQNVSDWYNPLGFNGESIAKTMAYRNYCDGTKDNRTFDVYGYSLAINPNKTVQSLTLPAPPSGTNESIMVLGAALSTNCGGANYCAVKLTQTALH